MRTGGIGNSGGTAGLRYVTVFSVEGPGEEQLKRIADSLEMIKNLMLAQHMEERKERHE